MIPESTMPIATDPRETMALLASRIDALGALVQRLAHENAQLREASEHLADERATLLSKNEQARSRVEAMIQKLKAMEASP